ncbi:MAG: DVUA0089 family protein [Betaproteobacteria bacterium]
MNTLRNTMAGLALAAVAAASGAATTLSGNLGDSGNGALVGSDLGVPDFTDDNAIANNVALYSFTVAQDGLVSLVSTGFAAGGVDPYFTLFTGSGAGATFLDSNYTQAFTTGGDFSWSATLAAGTYEIALGSFANMSFAENLGSGALGDGFIALGDPNSLFDGSYSLTLTTPDAPVPEPSTGWLLMAGMAGLAMRLRRGRQDA